MVNLKNNEIQNPNQANEFIPITKWEVWFQTPFGLIHDFKTAKERVEQADLDPDSTIVPIPVAISGNTYEVVIRL